MFTRFNSDPARLKKYAQESSGCSRYMLNTPGPGLSDFMADPQIRLQTCGSNWSNNPIEIEDNLIRQKKKVSSVLLSKDNNFLWVDETRASHPAFLYKSTFVDRWEKSFRNTPIDIPFVTNLNTRILEKDYFVPKIPVLVTPPLQR
jgi:hypothetical protein